MSKRILFGGKPRDPARIDLVLASIRAAWLEHPNLRLGQLLENHHPSPGSGLDLYHVEDSHWLYIFPARRSSEAR